MGEEKIRVTRLDRIEQRAMKSGWEIPEQIREQLMVRQMKIALSPESSNRDATSAFKALLSAEAMAKRHDRSQQPIRHEHVITTEDNLEHRRAIALARITGVRKDSR